MADWRAPARVIQSTSSPPSDANTTGSPGIWRPLTTIWSGTHAAPSLELTRTSRVAADPKAAATVVPPDAPAGAVPALVPIGEGGPMTPEVKVPASSCPSGCRQKTSTAPAGSSTADGRAATLDAPIPIILDARHRPVAKRDRSSECCGPCASTTSSPVDATDTATGSLRRLSPIASGPTQEPLTR